MKAGLRILAWPAFANRANNPYTSELYEAMPRQHIVDDMDMSFRALLRSPFVKADILHLHWLEKAFWGRRTAKAVATAVMTMMIVWLLKLRGTRIVWTAHNPEPHSKAGNANLNTWPLS